VGVRPMLCCVILAIARRYAQCSNKNDISKVSGATGVVFIAF
jgi:hypothetical protein